MTVKTNKPLEIDDRHSQRLAASWFPVEMMTIPTIDKYIKFPLPRTAGSRVRMRDNVFRLLDKRDNDKFDS